MEYITTIFIIYVCKLLIMNDLRRAAGRAVVSG
jgi:hypothetical protein